MGQNERLESAAGSQESSTILDRLYIYETSQFRMRAIGYALNAVIAFSYAILNAEVWGRPEKSVTYECLGLVVFLSFLIPILQVKMTQLHLPRAKFSSLERFLIALQSIGKGFGGGQPGEAQPIWATGVVTVVVIIVVAGSGGIIASAVADIARTLPTLLK